MVVCFLTFKNLNRSTQLALMGYATTSNSVEKSLLLRDRRIRASRLGGRVPSALQHLADMSIPFNPRLDVPYFWDVHFSGESVAESIFSKCHFLIQASEHGLKQPNFNHEKLEVFETQSGELYVNVDMTSRHGVKRAKKLGLAQERIAEVIISPQIYLVSSSVFDVTHRGRFFALFRHPVDRAISMYNYLGIASWDPMYNPSLKSMSLEFYAKSASAEHNWMTRFLVNKHGGRLRSEDMVVAKEILRTKCLVGLFEDLEPSMARFQVYFGWSQKQPVEQTSACRSAVIQAGDPRLKNQEVDKESTAWQALAAVNQYDLELYEYAKALYKLQGEQIFGIGVEQNYS